MVIKYLHTWEHTLLYSCVFNGLEWCSNPDEYFKCRELDQLILNDINQHFSRYIDRFVHYYISIIVERDTSKHIFGSHDTHSQRITKSRAVTERIVQLFHNTILTTHRHITLHRRDRRNRGCVSGWCSALGGLELGTA
ncbi:hypothetical protein D6C77_08433 [Aureobasidium pullulans]|uniref:Uncharacterized protein n=1 Tax=Aureobasidium pullulans TaxID=5580 RepID=A0A4T0CW88_AURPU|nr:hypothetical protein D6C98_00989 [Aureobasidium pullulans]THZ74343.1 hypothetical protein D6C85_03535 [Aureobasidium pullulans]TIA52638.1 hypothetical protein D6C77_08433 [Aureobasidium pullulans]